jgi:hypothetical protein
MNADSVNTLAMAWIRKRCCFVFCTAQWSAETQNPTWRIKLGKAFQWGSGGWEAEVCTPPGVLLAQMFVRVVFNVCLICMVFVAILIACRLHFS